MSPTLLAILGATGDLAGRYLLPALAELAAAGALPEDIEVVGVARDRLSESRFRADVVDRLGRHAADVPVSARSRLVDRLGYVAGDVTDPKVLEATAERIAGPLVAYLALPPAVFSPAIAGLVAAGLSTRTRLVVEKPFGTDLRSAQELNAVLGASFPEKAVFRIDHFLGKQTVQNILGVRFANRLFETLFCAEHVERVDIVWDETVASEGRAGYYDHTGALRDMVQNHLLQLLALVAMDRPSGLGEGLLRDAKVAVLRAVRRFRFDEVERFTTRARYLGYVSEPGVEPCRGTETFTTSTLFIDNERWRGVPFRLRTGKSLAAGRREVRVVFRAVERLPFGQRDEPGPNVLTMAMDPDRLAIDLALNGKGDPFCLDPARWELDLAPQRFSLRPPPPRRVRGRPRVGSARRRGRGVLAHR